MSHFEGILENVDLRFVAAMSDQEGDMARMGSVGCSACRVDRGE